MGRIRLRLPEPLERSKKTSPLVVPEGARVESPRKARQGGNCAVTDGVEAKELASTGLGVGSIFAGFILGR